MRCVYYETKNDEVRRDHAYVNELSENVTGDTEENHYKPLIRISSLVAKTVTCTSGCCFTVHGLGHLVCSDSELISETLLGVFWWEIGPSHALYLTQDGTTQP
jgi:hypothetical protein